MYVLILAYLFDMYVLGLTDNNYLTSNITCTKVDFDKIYLFFCICTYIILGIKSIVMVVAKYM